jgi:hypothetical protein
VKWPQGFASASFARPPSFELFVLELREPLPYTDRPSRIQKTQGPISTQPGDFSFPLVVALWKRKI